MNDDKNDDKMSVDAWDALDDAQKRRWFEIVISMTDLIASVRPDLDADERIQFWFQYMRNPMAGSFAEDDLLPLANEWFGRGPADPDDA